MTHYKRGMLTVVFFAFAAGLLLIICEHSVAWGALIIAVSLTLVMARPKIFIYMAILLLPLRDLIAGGERFIKWSYFNFDLGGLINILVIFLGVTYFVIHKKSPFRGILAKAYISFLILCAASLTYTTDFVVGLRFFTRLTSPFIFYLMVVNEIDIDKDRDNMVRCIFFSSVIPIIFGLYQFITGHGNADTHGFLRVYGSFGHPNTYSFYLLFLFCVGYTLFLSPRTKQKAPLALFVIIVFLLLLVTYCRIAWIAFLVIFVFLNYRYHKKWMTIPLVFIIPLFIYLFPSIPARVEDVAQVFKGNDILNTNISIGWRFNAWLYLLTKIPEHPFIGHGLREVTSMMQELYNVQISPHNGYLGILYDTGLIGFLSFLFVIYIMMAIGKHLMEKIREGILFDNASIYLSCLAAFVIILGSDNLFEYYNVALYFWVFFAIGSIMAAQQRFVQYEK